MTSRYIGGALVGVVLALGTACSPDGDSETLMPSAIPGGATTTEAGAAPTSTTSTPPIKVTRCDEVRLPDGGVGEADFDVNAAKGLLGIHFSGTRMGKYRNISYTVGYLEDPSCRHAPELAELIGRVGPPGWPPLLRLFTIHGVVGV